MAASVGVRQVRIALILSTDLSKHMQAQGEGFRWVCVRPPPAHPLSRTRILEIFGYGSEMEISSRGIDKGQGPRVSD